MKLIKKNFIDMYIHPRQHILSIFFSTLMIAATIIFSFSINENYHKNLKTYFPDNIIYVNDTVEPGNNYEVFPTMKLLDEDYIEPFVNFEDITIDINKLKPIDQTTDKLLKTIMMKVEEDKTLITYSGVYNYNSEIINDVIVPNRTYNIDKILCGNYPTSDNQIMIPETMALKIVNDNQLDSYDQVLGQSLKYKTNNYVVSGVYSTGDSQSGYQNIIFYKADQSDVELNGTFIKTDDEEMREKFIKLSTAISSKYNVYNYTYIFLVTTYVIIVVMYFSLIREGLYATRELLNHYNKTFKNNYPFFVAFMVFNLVYFIVYKILMR